MFPDPALLASMVVFATLIALPALAAACRRRVMREASEVAGALGAEAAAMRNSVAYPLDSSLWSRVQRLGAPEFPVLLLAQELPQRNPELLADTAQRLALRLKRRVAFERKMLARTASGRRRGAVAASIPPLALLVLHASRIPMPLAALLFVIAAEAFGCWLLWRVARVQI